MSKWATTVSRQTLCVKWCSLLHCFIYGHTHSPSTSPFSCQYICINNCVKLKKKVTAFPDRNGRRNPPSRKTGSGSKNYCSNCKNAHHQNSKTPGSHTWVFAERVNGDRQTSAWRYVFLYYMTYSCRYRRHVFNATSLTC